MADVSEVNLLPPSGKDGEVFCPRTQLQSDWEKQSEGLNRQPTTYGSFSN